MARLNAKWFNFWHRGQTWYHFWQDAAEEEVGGGWTNIAKVDGIASASIAKVDGIAVASISKVNGLAV